MKFSGKEHMVFPRSGNRDEGVFRFLPDGKRLLKTVMFVGCMMMIWVVGLGPAERMRELQNALCHGGSPKVRAEVLDKFSCETMSRDVEILSYLWLAATVAIPFLIFRRRPQTLAPSTPNPAASA